MSNLPKYEMLMLRHLQLLQKLYDADVTVACDDAGTWAVVSTGKPVTNHINSWLSPDEMRAAHHVDGHLPSAVNIGYSGDSISMATTDAWGRTRTVEWVKATPEQARLLAALVAAIVPPSPAKVD